MSTISSLNWTADQIVRFHSDCLLALGYEEIKTVARIWKVSVDLVLNYTNMVPPENFSKINRHNWTEEQDAIIQNCPLTENGTRDWIKCAEYVNQVKPSTQKTKTGDDCKVHFHGVLKRRMTRKPCPFAWDDSIERTLVERINFLKEVGDDAPFKTCALELSESSGLEIKAYHLRERYHKIINRTIRASKRARKS